MAKMDKLIACLKSYPKDFTWEELIRVLKGLGFKELQGSGSRVKFFNRQKNCLIQLHKPHPANTLKHYALKEIITILVHEKLI